MMIILLVGAEVFLLASIAFLGAMTIAGVVYVWLWLADACQPTLNYQTVMAVLIYCAQSRFPSFRISKGKGDAWNGPQGLEIWSISLNSTGLSRNRNGSRLADDVTAFHRFPRRPAAFRLNGSGEEIRKNGGLPAKQDWKAPVAGQCERARNAKCPDPPYVPIQAPHQASRNKNRQNIYNKTGDFSIAPATPYGKKKHGYRLA